MSQMSRPRSSRIHATANTPEQLTCGRSVWSYTSAFAASHRSLTSFTREKTHIHLLSRSRLVGFDYPSPYWDAVGDPALDLIDRMLTVDVEKRITVDECLEHPWTETQALSILRIR